MKPREQPYEKKDPAGDGGDEGMTPMRDALVTQRPRIARGNQPRSRDRGRSVAPDRSVISAEEAFRLLGIDRGTGYKAIRNGTFPVQVVRVGRLIRVPTAAIDRILNPPIDESDGAEA
jgi:excisionase family DNA binding protein